MAANAAATGTVKFAESRSGAENIFYCRKSVDQDVYGSDNVSGGILSKPEEDSPVGTALYQHL